MVEEEKLLDEQEESYECDVEETSLTYEDGETAQDILRSWYERENQIKNLLVDNLGICDEEWAAVLEAERSEVRKILDGLECEEYRRFV